MKPIIEILTELAADGSRLYKEAILQREKDSELLKRVIFLALDPFTQFYIRKIPDYIFTGQTISLETALEQLSKLSEREVTGHAAIEHLGTILGTVRTEEAEVIERIIEKDLKCGVASGTVNKIWPDFIKEYPVLLASPFEQKLVDKISWPAIAQLKSDGMRFNAVVHNGGVQYFSRKGRELYLMGKLDKYFLDLAAGVDVVFDGELRVFDELYEKFISRKEGNGILNKSLKGTISENEASRVAAVLWDIIPYSGFAANEVYECDYSERLDVLNERFSWLDYDAEMVSVIDTRIVHNQEETIEYYNELRAQGEEGIILKDKYSYWENKRSKKIIKFKAEHEADLRIVGIIPGEGKYEGLTGSVMCKTEDGVIKVDVGTGLTDEDRVNITEKDIGKIASIVYNEKIKNRKGEWSLFLPVFVEIREDKTLANTFGELE